MAPAYTSPFAPGPSRSSSQLNSRPPPAPSSWPGRSSGPATYPSSDMDMSSTSLLMLVTTREVSASHRPGRGTRLGGQRPGARLVGFSQSRRPWSGLDDRDSRRTGSVHGEEGGSGVAEPDATGHQA